MAQDSITTPTTLATPESLLRPSTRRHWSEGRQPAYPAPAESLLRLPEVENVVGIKKSKIYSLLQEGQFPAPVRLGPRSVRWKASAVSAWIANLTADPTGQGGAR